MLMWNRIEFNDIEEALRFEVMYVQVTCDCVYSRVMV